MAKGQDIWDRRVHWYTRLCRSVVRNFGGLASLKFQARQNATASRDLVKSIDFAKLGVEPWQITLTASTCAAGSGLGILLVVLVIFASVRVAYPGFEFGFTDIVLYLITPVFLIPLGVLIFLSQFPKIQARRLKVQSIGRMPEAISYLVMSMELNPSLNRAIEFAASNIDEPLASSMKKMLWDVYMRNYSDVESAFLDFAYEWGAWSDDFKRSLYAVRSAEMERSAEGVQRALAKANDIILTGTRKYIDDFANALSRPTLILYSLGILLPLLIGALLPILAMVGYYIGTIEVIVILNFLLPGGTLAYCYTIMGRRPGTTVPPDIPCPIPSRTRIIGGVILGVGGLALMVLGLSPIIGLGGTIAGVVLAVMGVGMPVAIYTYWTAKDQKAVRDEIKRMEDEFPDALFQLGSRISEGRPLELALRSTSETMAGTVIAKYFRKVSEVLQITRSTLDDAMYGDIGVFKNLPSKTIRTTMHTVVEATKKDNVTAGRTIVGISMYLRDMKEVEHDIKNKLGATVSMMRTTVTVFGPLILGITVALYYVLSGGLAGLSIPGGNVALPGASMKSIGTVNLIDPTLFALVVGVYLIENLMITIYFTVGIHHGDDWVERKVAIGRTVPISLVIFAVSVWAGLNFIV